ncbi:hypothetical protein L1887_09284 [Cichorium endivia]|nr:hypothetical protein L1887_09284 [Cichorium endivia]
MHNYIRTARGLKRGFCDLLQRSSAPWLCCPHNLKVETGILWLLQIQKQYKLITPGSSVLDLGCAPGAWLQVACQSLGPLKNGGVVVTVVFNLVHSRLQHRSRLDQFQAVNLVQPRSQSILLTSFSLVLRFQTDNRTVFNLAQRYLIVYRITQCTEDIYHHPSSLISIL